MSLFYNRDSNITGASNLASFTFDPNYGSSIAFTCKNNKYAQDNGSFAIIPSTLNNIVATCDFSFTVNEEDAKSIINFFESQNGTGAFAIQDASQIYRPLTGFADGFNVSAAQNNLFNISLNFSVERNSSMLNWSGMSFVNYDFVSWASGQSYKKYQPAYFEIQAQNKLANFYYATQDHVSSAENCPPNTGFWSQSLFYENDLGMAVKTRPMVKKTEFKNAFAFRVKDGENIHAIQQLQLSYKNLSDFQLKSMLHFLESSLGYKKFQFTLPKVYNRPKMFYAQDWQHSWNYKDSNNLVINIVEDPLGIKTQDDVPAFIVGQNKDKAALKFTATPSMSAFVLDASGAKEPKSAGEHQITWGSVSPKNLKMYRELSDFRAYKQGVESVIFYPRCNVENCDLALNKITNVAFEGGKNIGNLNLRVNTLTSFVGDGVTGLKNLNLSSNRLTSVSLSGCNSLTGINLDNNQVSQSSLSAFLWQLAFGSGVSGNISVLGGINFIHQNPTPQSGADYLSISSLDYRNWTQSYKNLSLPIKPTGYVDAGAFSIWLRDNFSAAVTNSHSAKWESSLDTYPAIQPYTPNPSLWGSIQPNQFYQRPAYHFNQTVLTGSGINNSGDYLSSFVVARFDTSDDQCLLNYSPDKHYGLFYSGDTVSLRDGATVNVLASGISGSQYYSLGFVRNSTTFTGFVNGQVSATGSVAASDLSSIKLSVGGAEGANPKHFAGNLAEVLVFSHASEFALNTGFHRPYNARFGIYVP